MRPRRLAAGQPGERRLDRHREADGGEGGFDPRFEDPVGVGQFGEVGLSPAGARERFESRASAEQIDKALARLRLQGLPEKPDALWPRDAPRLQRDFTGDGAQERRLPDRVPADDAGSLRAEAQIET